MNGPMSNRGVEIAGFLAQSGWETASHTAFEADFSPRRYARLQQSDGRRAILMDADADQKTMNFVRLAKVLSACGLAAPIIHAANPMQGLVLMEDFGDRNLGRLLDEGAEARPLYRRAVDVLVQLHRHFQPAMLADIDTPVFNAALFAAQAELFLDAYVPYVLDRDAVEDERIAFALAWRDVLRYVDALPQSLLLRDYMPDNLMDLPGREGVQGLGVLDFQDGGLGPIAYDLASLCEVVRRDGGDALFDELMAYYHGKAQPAVALDDLRRASVILSAQRHTRILGIIVRLMQKGRADKLSFLPRVTARLKHLLQDDALKPVRDVMVGIGVTLRG